MEKAFISDRRPETKGLKINNFIKSVHDQLKHLCYIEHSRHRNPWNFAVNLLAALVTYRLKPKKPLYATLDIFRKIPIIGESEKKCLVQKTSSL